MNNINQHFFTNISWTQRRIHKIFQMKHSFFVLERYPGDSWNAWDSGKYGWWFRNPACTSWYGKYHHYLQSFIHLRWCRISSCTVLCQDICSIFWWYHSSIIIHISGQICNDLSRGHPKWWFSKGPIPQNPQNSGLGIIVICPDSYLLQHFPILAHLFLSGGVSPWLQRFGGWQLWEAVKGSFCMTVGVLFFGLRKFGKLNFKK